VEKLVGGVRSATVGSIVGDVSIAAAQQSLLGNESATVWFTDPPYYDAIPYAALSDFFFVWLKRALPNHPRACPTCSPRGGHAPKLRPRGLRRGAWSSDGTRRCILVLVMQVFAQMLRENLRDYEYGATGSVDRFAVKIAVELA
jgi:hypothetical protein